MLVAEYGVIAEPWLLYAPPFVDRLSWKPSIQLYVPPTPVQLIVSVVASVQVQLNPDGVGKVRALKTTVDDGPDAVGTSKVAIAGIAPATSATIAEMTSTAIHSRRPCLGLLVDAITL